MARDKTRWVCRQCGFQTSRYLGRCTECDSWNTLVEEIIVETALKGGGCGTAEFESAPVPLVAHSAESQERLKTGFTGVDEVLGGGLAPGSVVLLAGDPGIGKSTLLLQVAQAISEQCPVSYISGEESVQQVQMRAARLGLGTGIGIETGTGTNSCLVSISCRQNVLLIEKDLLKGDTQGAAQVAIIDSVQSLFHPDISSAPGSVSQVRETAAVLTTAAKAKGVSVIMIGHVTKDGAIAGPRVLEHMVDVVMQFESADRNTSHLRILRATKNRFGSTAEIAVFSMDEKGLKEVDSPGGIFLGSRLAAVAGKRAPSGTSVTVVAQGNRGLTLEVQALVSASSYSNPRRVATGLEFNRLLQILAVLEKKAGMDLSRHDVYLNIAGGFEFDDPGGDLAIAGAIATSHLDRSLDTNLVMLGEIGLTGEVRPVAGIEQRLKEAYKMGFSCAVVPAGNLPLNGHFEGQLSGMTIVPVKFVGDALAQVMPHSAQAALGQIAPGQVPAQAPAQASVMGVEGIATSF